MLGSIGNLARDQPSHLLQLISVTDCTLPSAPARIRSAFSRSFQTMHRFHYHKSTYQLHIPHQSHIQSSIRATTIKTLLARFMTSISLLIYVFFQFARRRSHAAAVHELQRPPYCTHIVHILLLTCTNNEQVLIILGP